MAGKWHYNDSTIDLEAQMQWYEQYLSLILRILRPGGRRHFFTQSVVRVWNRFPNHVVDAETFGILLSFETNQLLGTDGHMTFSR